MLFFVIFTLIVRSNRDPLSYYFDVGMTIEELPLSMLRGLPFNLQGGGGVESLSQNVHFQPGSGLGAL